MPLSNLRALKLPSLLRQLLAARCGDRQWRQYLQQAHLLSVWSHHWGRGQLSYPAACPACREALLVSKKGPSGSLWQRCCCRQQLPHQMPVRRQ